MKSVLNGRVLPVLLAAAASAYCAEGGRTNVACDVAIVGGGAGGVHTAYRLGAQLGNKVCLFEKENRLGGRIHDYARTPGGPVFGLGALRIMETQDVLFSLADELGISYASAGFEDDRINARGQFAYDSDTLRALAYPQTTMSEGDLYNVLLIGPERANIDQYPEFRSYVRKAIGAENATFLAEVFRFRGDFTYPLSAKGYMEFLDEDWNVCCTPSYPVGGMSQFIEKMAAKARQAGVRIYLSEPAQEVNSGPGNGGRYSIVTPNYTATANRLVIAVDAEAFKKVGGSVASRIQAQPQFQDLIGVKVAVINQYWPSAWWVNAIPGKNTRRAWTTEHCVNFIEIPTTPYAANQLVTRTVYDDNRGCVDFWETTAQRGTAAVEAEIMRGLKHLFPGVSIPQPLETVVKIWPAGWYWLKAGSPFTNMQIASWAITPLAGEQVSLVGESYNPQRSTWSDGAYKSSINALNSLYGFNLPGQTATPSGPLPVVTKPKNVPPGLRRGR